MTIKVTKPAINIREELADLKQDTGLKGQELMRADTAQEVRTAISAGRKNLIINGGFDVWQRGTPRVTTMYCADRWMVWSTNSGVANRNVTATKRTGSISGLGYKANYTSFAFGTVDTGIEKFAWGQKIEASSLNNINVGDSLTLSYYIKKEQSMPTDNSFYTRILTPSPSGTDAWEAGYLFQNYETIAATLNTTTFNSLSTSWTKLSHTFTATATMISDGIAVYWHVGDTNMGVTSTSDLVSFTGVQLEVGSVATEFEHRSYGEELALCQRYYQRFVSDASYTAFGVVRAADSTNCKGVLTYRTTMRASPTFAQSNTGFNIGPQYTVTSIGTTYAGKDCAWVDLTSSGASLTAGQAVVWNANNNAAAYVELNSEL